MDLLRRVVRYQDPALAIALGVLLLIELAVAGPPVPDDAVVVGAAGWAATIVGALALIGSLAVRRRYPLLPLAVALAVAVVAAREPLEGPVSLLVAIAVATYAASAQAPGRRAVVAAFMVAGLIAIVLLQPGDQAETAADVAAVAFVIGGPWLAGVAMRERRNREAVLEERAAAAEHDREERAAAAVAEERARIARELHDIVAHSISVIVLLARGARRTMTADPAATRAALDSIDAVGSDALAEMRRLVGLARTPGVAPSLAPRPGLGSLDTMVDLVRAAGLAVDVEEVGVPFELPAGIDLAAFRIVQEALTNALAHASPGRATVTIRYEVDHLDIEVVDSGPGGAGQIVEGHGLTGMRERVQLYGGSMETGRADDGGFAVRVALPVVQGAR